MEKEPASHHYRSPGHDRPIIPGVAITCLNETFLLVERLLRRTDREVFL